MVKPDRPHLICLSCYNAHGQPPSYGKVTPPHGGCCWCGQTEYAVWGTRNSAGVQCQGVHLYEVEGKT